MVFVCMCVNVDRLLLTLTNFILQPNEVSQHDNYSWALSCRVCISLGGLASRPEEACESHAIACHQAKYRL